ncbi:MAG: tRNA (N(6)-L-threonylcarbamoyladenosine(37)-C(2))-methylthiotransferase MtaB, partial [Flavobacteriaceae bacterium]|nr:tRNA (N(6)-L-threonylcarbamoyladenosine(37)-C(2))-methylthiotransferase MtaB [Eudoraea sp.]NNJ38932.1 tRNA (N(6)-L-threonylcarbamoyladenosine(37)-C(2))-methylthiotransferase MtaB [Flavobacteriaceae bacterium]
TLAAAMEEAVPQRVRQKRSRMLRALSVKKRRAFYEYQLGSVSTVLFEGENKAGYIHGFTENYVKVRAPWNPKLVNTLHRVMLQEIDKEGMVRIAFENASVTA